MPKKKPRNAITEYRKFHLEAPNTVKRALCGQSNYRTGIKNVVLTKRLNHFLALKPLEQCKKCLLKHNVNA